MDILQEEKKPIAAVAAKGSFAVELIFKHADFGRKLSEEEKQLLHSCIGEILGEIEIEEKRIIEEERRAALEVTAHNHQKEG